MKTQTYYTAPNEPSANLCDNSREIVINCVGAVERNHFSARSVRNDYYIMYVIRGSQTICFDNKTFVIADGDLLILEPHTPYSYSTKDAEVNYLWLHFTGYGAQQKLHAAGLQTNTILHCGHSVRIIELWERMCHEFTIHDQHFETMSHAVFTQILTTFSRKIQSIGKGKNLQKSLVYIHENYSQKISIATLAKIEGFSQSHYRALFAKIHGESPVEYITKQRIMSAVYMLENTDCRLDEIATSVGFNDAYYFGRKFKQVMGISPGKYRNTQLLTEPACRHRRKG
jgi:AraC-like DNA-binding protein